MCVLHYNASATHQAYAPNKVRLLKRIAGDNQPPVHGVGSFKMRLFSQAGWYVQLCDKVKQLCTVQMDHVTLPQGPVHPQHVHLSKEAKKKIRSNKIMIMTSCWVELSVALRPLTETIGLLGMGAQDGQLDFHTAPELWLQQ